MTHNRLLNQNGELPKNLGGAVLIGQPKPVKLSIARLTYGAKEHPALGSWLARTCHSFLQSPIASGLDEFFVDKQPVYSARNFAAKRAVATGSDYLLMVDADQIPDVDPQAPPFVQVALMFAIRHAGPCVVAAPTPMTNGHCNIHREITDDEGLKHLRLIPLHEAAEFSGIQEVPAAGTGMMLIDCRCFTTIDPPWFAFNYADETMTDITAGEDVLFGARLQQAGVPTYATWDSWSGHAKSITLGRPRIAPQPQEAAHD